MRGASEAVVSGKFSVLSFGEEGRERRRPRIFKTEVTENGTQSSQRRERRRPGIFNTEITEDGTQSSQRGKNRRPRGF
jgi:hypothetical protein